jgi:hypothetical protein
MHECMFVCVYVCMYAGMCTCVCMHQSGLLRHSQNRSVDARNESLIALCRILCSIQAHAFMCVRLSVSIYIYGAAPSTAPLLSPVPSQPPPRAAPVRPPAAHGEHSSTVFISAQASRPPPPAPATTRSRRPPPSATRSPRSPPPPVRARRRRRRPRGTAGAPAARASEHSFAREHQVRMPSRMQADTLHACNRQCMQPYMRTYRSALGVRRRSACEQHAWARGEAPALHSRSRLIHRAVRDAMLCGIPCFAGYHAVRDTVPCGIPC